ncbi:MAG: YggS family pyridoxal phosphate-dependent enzyme [Chloroflexi bacterium]|nr:MAG: YggS family pyridoxal phosphate-dependent enzyme [Chloroflexota bacterium]TME51981.1 MAG: YggS family pyridoxal phosphate-dependent enzyme [Chloroflexota bacterium]
MSLEENLAAVRERITRTGRNPDEITIVAVTKGFGAEVCRQAIEAGLTNLGENRVQEALAKMREVPPAEWHLIGHLQTNKVRLVRGRFVLIQSVDSLHLAQALARADSNQKVLIEVNVAREPQKTGVDPAGAMALIQEVSKLVEMKGLMAMGPTDGDPTPAFGELRVLRDEAQQRLGTSLPILSMGMSGDYELAVRAGSTMVRLGQALFGPRP